MSPPPLKAAGKPALRPDWNAHADAFWASESDADSLRSGLTRLALWASQIEQIEPQNPALAFVRMMRLEGLHAAALVPLALYRPAASSLRAMVESALSYTYFRTHPTELATLARDPEYMFDKEAVLTYLNQHIEGFTSKQGQLGLVAKLRPWYKRVSAVVHGQHPGAWAHYERLDAIAHNPAARKVVLADFTDAVDIIHRLFLCTCVDLWPGVDHEVKVQLLRGLKPTEKRATGLDTI